MAGDLGPQGGAPAIATLVAVVFVVGIGLWWYLVRDTASLEGIIESERRLRDLNRVQPVRTFVLGFVLYVLVSLFPGTSGKAVVAGWVFGFWPAVGLVIGALTAAGLIGFWLARCLLRDWIRHVVGSRFDRFDRALGREGEFYLLTLRFLHAPFTLVNYLSGVSTVRPRAFVWTTAVGLVPGTLVLVGVGASLPSLSELRETGVIGLVDPALLVALGAVGLVPWVIRRITRAHRGFAAGRPDVNDVVPHRRSR